MTKEAPRKIISSFNVAQLRQIGSEISRMTEGFSIGPLSVEMIKGLIDTQPLDERGRKRLEIGFMLWVNLTKMGKTVDEVREVLVWQIGDDERNTRAEWRFRSPVTRSFRR